MKSIFKKYYSAIAITTGLIVFILVWFIIAKIIGEEAIIFPGPYKTFSHFVSLLSKKYTYECIIQSLLKTFIGFIISFVIALITGIIASMSSFIQKMLIPFMSALKSMPTASILFLFFILSGADNAPIYVVILVALPILYESVIGGIKAVPKSIIEASRLDSGKTIKTMLKIRLPLASNYILVGIASSFSLAFKVEIMAEILTGTTNKGIGSAIQTAQKTDPNMTPIFSWTLIAIIIALIITLLSGLIKKKIQKHIF